MGIPHGWVYGTAAGMSMEVALRWAVGTELGRRTVISMATSTGKKVAPDAVMAAAAAAMSGLHSVEDIAKAAEITPPAQATMGPPAPPSTPPPEFSKWLATRTPESQAAIKQNIRSMLPDEAVAYMRSLVHP